MTAVQPSSRAGTIAIGTCREQSSNASSLWRKTQMSSVLEILILVMTSAPMDKTELAIFERLVCPIWNTGTRWLRETDLTKAKTFFTRNAQRRLGEYNRWAALARVPRSQIPRRCFVSTGCAKVQWSGNRELRDSSAGLLTPAIGSSAALLPDPTHWIICLCAPLAP